MVETQEYCQKIIETAITHAGSRVDGIEVSVSGSNIATSRFANNGMTQNQSPETEAVSVRVLIGGRQARLSGDQTDAKSIRDLVDNTISAAKLLERDPDLPDLYIPDKDESPAINRFDAFTAAIDPQGRAQQVKEMIAVAKESGLVGAGTYSSGQFYSSIGNSKGLFKYHAETSAEASITMRAGDASGWAKAQSAKASDISAATLAQSAALKAQRGINPTAIAPGRYTVILEPAAVLDLLCFLWYDFSATSHLDKISSLLNKEDKKIFAQSMDITDDFRHPLQAGAGFDGEGVNRLSVKLIDQGILKNLVYGRRSAKKLRAATTGHGLPEPNVFGEYPENLVVAGGDSSLEEMIASSQRAVLITRVWYVRVVDPANILLTGLTQDGTFLVEDGHLRSGIKNMRFNVSIHEMLNNILALGPSVRAAGEEGAPAVVPAMMAANFNFTEHSLF